MHLLLKDRQFLDFLNCQLLLKVSVSHQLTNLLSPLDYFKSQRVAHDLKDFLLAEEKLEITVLMLNEL